jgi:hypothetical protein
VVGAVVAAVVGGLGVLLVVAPFAAADPDVRRGRWFLAALGLALVATAAVVVLARVAGPSGRRASAAAPGGRPRVDVRLNARVPATLVLLGSTFTLLFAGAVLGVGVADGGLLFLPLVLLFAALVPDGVRGLLRGSAMVLDEDGVAYRGWTVDAVLAWEDVLAVGLDTFDPRRPRIVISGRPGAPSWRCDSHRLVLPLDRVPSEPRIAVLAAGLDHPTRVEVLLRNLAAAPAAERAALLDADAVAFLNGAR